NFLDLREKPDGTFPVNLGAPSNPLQTAALLKNREDVWRFIGSSTASYKLWSDKVNGVNLQGNFGGDSYQQANHIFSPAELQYEPNDGLLGTVVDGSTSNLSYNVGVGGVWTFTPLSKDWRSALSTGFTYDSVDLSTVDVFAQNLNAGQDNTSAGTVINT